MEFECSYSEVMLILIMREMRYGTVEVHLSDGDPARVTTSGSLLLSDPRQVLSWVTNDKERLKLFRKLNLIN